MSETKPGAVFAAWGAVIADMARDGVAKDRNNAGQGYKFRGIDDVLNALSASYAKHGLAVRVDYGNRTREEGKTAKGGPMFTVALAGDFTLVSTRDGSQARVGVFHGEAMDSADKATNKAMSAAYKYFALQTFAIPTEGDNDADAHSPEVAPRSQPVRNEQPKHDGFAITSGPAKGKRFSEASDDELNAYGNSVVAVLSDRAKEQHHAQAQRIIDAIEAEFVQRSGNGR